MKTTPKNKGLSNPAAAAVVTSEAGQKAIDRANRYQEVAVEAAGKTLPWLIKLVVIAGSGYLVYRLYSNRFVKEKFNTNYPPANINDAQANAKANAIYSAMYGIGANKDAVKVQLEGLNFNGWIKVYNAFGNREPWNLFGAKMNLVDWLNDQFDDDELAELRFVLPGVF